MFGPQPSHPHRAGRSRTSCPRTELPAPLAFWTPGGVSRSAAPFLAVGFSLFQVCLRKGAGRAVNRRLRTGVVPPTLARDATGRRDRFLLRFPGRLVGRGRGLRSQTRPSYDTRNRAPACFGDDLWPPCWQNVRLTIRLFGLHLLDGILGQGQSSHSEADGKGHRGRTLHRVCGEIRTTARRMCEGVSFLLAGSGARGSAQLSLVAGVRSSGIDFAMRGPLWSQTGRPSGWLGLRLWCHQHGAAGCQHRQPQRPDADHVCSARQVPGTLHRKCFWRASCFDMRAGFQTKLGCILRSRWAETVLKLAIPN